MTRLATLNAAEGSALEPNFTGDRSIVISSDFCCCERMNTGVLAIVSEVLARAPDWVRSDLAAKDPAIRSRAEETLAAMIAAAIDGKSEADSMQ